MPNEPPINARFPLIVVRRVYFDQFAAGTKTTEYRRHRGVFRIRTFYPGRWVRIAYHYNVKIMPTLLAVVEAFDVAPARDHPMIFEVYSDLKPDDEIALIRLAIRRAGNVPDRAVGVAALSRFP